jgi:hypothetical protein
LEQRKPPSGLDYRPLFRGWAKIEIVLGLGAGGGGLLLASWAVSRPVVEWAYAAVGWALFVLGGYLALAGHRSHLYQSSNEQTAYLTAVIHERDKGAAS